MERNPVDTYELAKALHETGRAAVEAGQTVAHSMQGQTSRVFIEWDSLSLEAKIGRQRQAQALLERFEVFHRGSNDSDGKGIDFWKDTYVNYPTK